MIDTAAKLKRKPRKDTGRKIVVRLTEDEFKRLQREAGAQTTISQLVRSRLLARGMRGDDLLRQVAALHVLGRRLTAVASSGSAEAERNNEGIGGILAEIRAAIAALARHLPGTEAEAEEA